MNIQVKKSINIKRTVKEKWEQQISAKRTQEKQESMWPLKSNMNCTLGCITCYFRHCEPVQFFWLRFIIVRWCQQEQAICTSYLLMLSMAVNTAATLVPNTSTPPGVTISSACAATQCWRNIRGHSYGRTRSAVILCLLCSCKSKGHKG